MARNISKLTKLNLGCGRDIRKDFVNVDFRKFEGVDIAFDFNKFPYPLKKDTFDCVICYHVLEHVDFVPGVLKELHRVCKKGAVVHIKVPYYNHPCAWVDCTHQRGFTTDTLDDFGDDQPKTGTYANTYPKFKIEKKLNPTILGKFIPFKRLRRYLSYVLGFIIKEIEFKMTVVK